MLFIVFLGLGILLVSSVTRGQSKTAVVMCSSFSCAYNRRGHCTRLCLHHSETMSKRIIEPMGKVGTIERGKPNPQMIGKIMKIQEDKRDSELVKNPKAFTNWMRKHLR